MGTKPGRLRTCRDDRRRRALGAGRHCADAEPPHAGKAPCRRRAVDRVRVRAHGREGTRAVTRTAFLVSSPRAAALRAINYAPELEILAQPKRSTYRPERLVGLLSSFGDSYWAV